MDSDKKTIGPTCPNYKLEFKLSLSSGGIQTPPFQYCCKVSKPHLSNIVARYPNPTFPILLQGIQTPIFPILFQGIQTLPLQYSFKVSKHNLSNIVSRYPNPPFQYSFKASKPCLSITVSRYPNPAFPILLKDIQSPPFQYSFKLSKPHLSNKSFKVMEPTLFNIVFRHPGLCVCRRRRSLVHVFRWRWHRK